jgi:hypothetical protein
MCQVNEKIKEMNYVKSNMNSYKASFAVRPETEGNMRLVVQLYLL